MKQLPNLSPEQAKVYDVIARIKMAWVALWVFLALFIILCGAFLYSLFCIQGQGVAKLIIGGIDALLAWGLKIILGNLFPPRQG